MGPRSHECCNKEPKKLISSLNFACNAKLVNSVNYGSSAFFAK